MSIEYDRWWLLKDGKFIEKWKEESKEITEDYLIYPGTTTDLDVLTLKSDSVEQTVDKILEQQGAWSIVYFNRNIRKLFIGRDVFGRQSLVLNVKSMIFGCRVLPGTCLEDWVEVPFGQVTVFDVDEPNDHPMIYSYLNEYPDGVMNKYLHAFPSVVTGQKSKLLTVSRSTGGEASSFNALKLFEKTTEATKVLLRNNKCTHVAVCLSGGVDSTFIAHIVHASVPREVNIDLINVAFGNSSKECELAPDRSRARKALESFRIAYPNRLFRLILVNVDAQTLSHHRVTSVAPAAQPASSVLDDSLACVLWFAVRAEGLDSDTNESVKSPASTCLLGSGADELLAGYARHRTRFEKEQIPENVAEECENELRRLGSRNGGRDARVAAQLGKTILSPLLEDSVVTWLNSLPVDAKWNLSLPRGVGEKLLLRETVKMLGSPYDAPKQAMQFGSRMAKMSNNGNNSIKGSDKSPHF